MKRIEDQYKIMQLRTYKTLIDNAFLERELTDKDSFEMQNMLEGEIENVVERMLFDNAYEIFPN